MAAPAAGNADPRYGSADDLIDDLNTMERALVDAHCESLATSLVRPLRREVEVFRFRTVRLDLRENSTVTTKALSVAVASISTAAPSRPSSGRRPGISGFTMS